MLKKTTWRVMRFGPNCMHDPICLRIHSNISSNKLTLVGTGGHIQRK